MFCGVCDHRDINYTEMAYEAIRSRKNVYFVTFIVNLIYLNAGMTLTWTSPTIPRLQEPNQVLVITPSQGNYITTGASIGVILGPLISGLLTSYIGRKKSIYIIICSYVLHWFLLWLALSVECLWFGRLIGGFSMGTSLATLPLYIAEISEADIRGLLNSIPMSVRSFGFLWNYIAGPYVSYMNLIYSCSLVPVVLLILGLFLPETPYYLISTGKKAKALKTLCWLRSASREDVYQEFVKIQDSIEKANAEKTSVMWLFKNPVNLRAMCLGAAARFSLSSCGFFTILINMESIFIAADIGVSSSVACIIVGSVIFCTATTSPFITKSYGYKKPFVSSLIALSFILGVLGLYFMLLQHGYIHSWLTYVPVVCLIIHATLISFGVSNTAFALTGEMFPPNLRAAGSALTNTFGFLMSNLLVVYYFAVKDIAGLYTVFWTLSMLTLIAAIFHLVCLPETSRLSLEEIQEKLKKPLLKRNRKRNEVY